ncbi:MAG: hypothetical protein EAZ16_03540 [Sphingobacteriales bacterium]|nr:MAG: hypothetical protein EAZ16_03540 [Sphingobacteriales bacterium]
MGEIRKQTIQSSFLSYIGFFIGAINTWLFTKDGLFTTEQYGLTQVIISIAQILAPLATLGTTAFISRFFPYYFEKLSNKENDMLGMAVLVTGVGALLVFSGCIIFEPFVVRKFSEKSKLVVDYYYWTLVFSFFFLCFILLESYMGALKKTVLPNFMKETGYRLLVLLLVAAYLFRWINFSQFVIGFCCTYFIISTAIIIYLKRSAQFYLNFKRRPNKWIILPLQATKAWPLLAFILLTSFWQLLYKFLIAAYKPLRVHSLQNIGKIITVQKSAAYTVAHLSTCF